MTPLFCPSYLQLLADANSEDIHVWPHDGSSAVQSAENDPGKMFEFSSHFVPVRLLIQPSPALVARSEGG